MTSGAAELAAFVNKQMGKDTIRMGDDPFFNVSYLRTGLEPIDDLLQGGFAFGRFAEIFGDYSTLKTYIGLKAIERCQGMGKLAGLIDTEHAFDPQWAKDVGVDVADLIVKHPETGEEAIDILESLIRGGVDFVVFDSVAAALPRSEQQTMLSGDKNIQPARQAQLMSQAMRKLTAPNIKTAVLWINQTRQNVGVMFGSNETVPGGKALGFYASQRIAVRKAGWVTEPIETFVMEDGKPKKKTVKKRVAMTIRATLEKSKLNQPHREVMFSWDFRTNQIDTWAYLLGLALEDGVVTYDRGLYWVTNAIHQTKYRGREAFQKAVDEDKLKFLLGRQPGRVRLAKKRGGAQRSASSNGGVQGNIRARAQGESKKTVRIRRRSTK